MIPHALFETLSYTVGFAVYRFLRSRAGDAIPDSTRWSVIAAAAAGAAVGSKVLFWFEDPVATLALSRNPAYLMGGKTIVGGLIGGLIAVEWTKRVIGESRSTGDLFALPLCAGIAIGRIGCWLAGPEDHTWGRATASVLGVDGGDGVLRHCLPLYEVAFLGGLMPIIYRVRQGAHRSGDAFRLFMIGYLSFRLAIEGLKDTATVGGLTAIQWACAATLLYYAAAIRRRASASLQPEKA